MKGEGYDPFCGIKPRIKVVWACVSIVHSAGEMNGGPMCHCIGDPSLRQAKSWLPLSPFLNYD